MKRVGFFVGGGGGVLIPVQSKRVKGRVHVLYSLLTCDWVLAITAVNYCHIKSFKNSTLLMLSDWLLSKVIMHRRQIHIDSIINSLRQTNK